MEASWKRSLEWGQREGIPGEIAAKAEVGKLEVRVERLAAWLR